MDICQYLCDHGITYERYDHEPVFTCEQADRLHIPQGSAKTKNLFLRDRKGRRHILVTVGAAKSVDIRAMESILDAKSLSFASPERLERYLGLTPGAVTVLGVVNDPQGLVEVVVDKDLLAYPAMQCHPNTNSSTLVIPLDDVMRFLQITGHAPRIISVPAHAQAL
jgi:Ala-tRNA(Pro) deacylase